jgi:hypothetical protein
VKEREDLILDIRSGSLGLAIISYAGAKREITHCVRKSLPLQKDFESSRLIVQVGNALRQLLTETQSQRPKFRPHKIHIVIGSPWHLSETSTVLHKSPKEVEYDEKLVRKLFADEESDFRVSHFGERKPETIEREMLLVTLNGYPTSRPFGRSASEIGITFYLSMIDTDFLDVVRSAVGSVWKADQIFHTFPYLSLLSTKTLIQGHADSYLILDIGGEVSELSLIRNSVALEGFSFPLGAHSIMRDIASALGLTLPEAGSIYKAFTLGQVDKKISAQIEKVLSDIKIKWITYLHNIFENISTLYVLPSVIVAVGNLETGRIIEEVITDEGISKLFTNAKSPSVIIPDPGTILSEIAVKPTAGVMDIFLAIEASTLEKITYKS